MKNRKYFFWQNKIRGIAQHFILGYFNTNNYSISYIDLLKLNEVCVTIHSYILNLKKTCPGFFNYFLKQLGYTEIELENFICKLFLWVWTKFKFSKVNYPVIQKFVQSSNCDSRLVDIVSSNPDIYFSSFNCRLLDKLYVYDSIESLYPRLGLVKFADHLYWIDDVLQGIRRISQINRLSSSYMSRDFKKSFEIVEIDKLVEIVEISQEEKVSEKKGDKYEKIYEDLLTWLLDSQINIEYERTMSIESLLKEVDMIKIVPNNFEASLFFFRTIKRVYK